LVLHHHLRHLAPRHEVTLLSAGEESASRSVPAYARRRVASWRRGEPDDVIKVESSDVVAAFTGALARRPDVVHLHGWGTAQLARFAAGVPVVHVAIDPWTTGLRAHQARPWWRRAIEFGELGRVRRHEARHYPRCDRVVVVSATDADALARAVPGARVVAIPNGVDIGPEPPDDRPTGVLGFHGALSTPANADAARRLVREVLPRVPGARAIVIGRDPPDDLRGPGVTVTGEVDDVGTALRDVSVYVAAIERGGGMRNKVLEAMAAGVPVVASPRAVEGIGDGDGIIVAASVDAIALAAARLLADPAQARAIGLAGRARVAGDFTWARAGDAVEAIWRELVDGAAAAPHQ
jgi:glycosyltransferase involved in cell wall biosynthesis